MKKISKIIVITIIVLLLLIGFVISIPFIFKDKVRDIVVEQINENVNAKVEFIDYDLTIFSTFPDLNFELNNLTTVGINDFEGDTLLSLKSLNFSIDIMSVFGDEIKINGITLDKPNIFAKVLQDGKANWDIAKESTDTVVAETSTEETKFKLSLKEFNIIEANVIYDDKQMDFFTKILNLNFSLIGDMTQDFTSLETKTNIESIDLVFEGIKYLNKAKTEIIADLDADLLNSKYTFKENIFRINELELGFDGFIEMPKDDIGMDIKFDAKKTEFKNILSLVPAVYMTDFNNVKTEGKLALNGFAKGIYNDNSLPAFELNLTIADAMFKYPDLPKSANNINIDVNVKNENGVVDNTITSIKKFHIDFAGNPFDMRMLIKTPVSDPFIDGEIKGKIDFNTLKDVVPLDSMTISGIVTADVLMKGNMSTIEKEKYEEFNASGTVELTNFIFTSSDLPQGMNISQAKMNFTPKNLQLQSFDSKIGKSDIKLTGTIDNFLAYTFRDELLKGSFTMNSTLLDVNEFMSDEESSSATTNQTAETELTVYEVPKNIDFVFSSTIGKILYDNMEMTNASGNIIMREGIVDLSNLKMNMLDGTIVLNGKYDTKDISKPAVDFKMNIQGFDIQKSFNTFNTIQKLAPIAEHCSGKFSTELEFYTLLDNTMMPVINSINSSGRLQTKNIVITNSKSFSKIADELKMEQFKKLNPSDLDVKFIIKDGKITVDPFKTKLSKSESQIGGFMDLDQNLNFDMVLKIPRSEFGSAANQVVNNLVSQAASKGVKIEPSEVVNVNVKITGTATNPVIKLDLKQQADDLMNSLKDKAKEELDKAKQELERKAREEADKLKNQAEAEAQRLKQEAEQKAKEAQDKAKAEAERLRKEAEAAAAKAKAEAEQKAKEEAKKRLNGILKN